MSDFYSEQNQERKRELIRTYTNAPQLGLVLGAGVMVDSGVPNYAELALRLFEEISQEEEDWVRVCAKRQSEFLANKDERAVPPEDVVTFVHSHCGNDDQLLRKLVWKALYRDVEVCKASDRAVLEANPTLNSILTFCAARPNTVLAPALDPPLSKTQSRIGTNVKVGGILTTNYDNLLESMFERKYGTDPLVPVSRPTCEEAVQDRRLIPVYHIHGYVRYREKLGDPHQETEPHLVIAEEDYYRTFYDPLGFGTYISMSFLRRFPCLFVGCSMKDKNLRRFLFHLAQEGVGTGSDPRQQKFALLETTGTWEEDELTDVILQSYGVQVIWVGDFAEIPGIFRDLYTSVRGVDRSDWDALV